MSAGLSSAFPFSCSSFGGMIYYRSRTLRGLKASPSPLMTQFSFSRTASLLVVAAAFAAAPLSAQIDLSGNWGAMFLEDQPERIPGPELGDYLGLPINEANRERADAWSPSRLTMPEQQCRVHVSPYIYRGPTNLRIWEEKDPFTQQLVAIHVYSQTYEQERAIYMDGRPHPPDYALHTWMGFSTGKWQGDILTTYTTHIKTGWVRRNGLVESDHATLVEHWIRHDDLLTHVSIMSDPAYLTEPLVKSQDFRLNTRYNGNWLYPCESVEEVVGRPEGAVPNFLPGQNPFLTEFEKNHPMVPYQAARGGAETMYPEYRQKLKTESLTPPPAPAAAK
jgi:hypothetical protein